MKRSNIGALQSVVLGNECFVRLEHDNKVSWFLVGMGYMHVRSYNKCYR